MSLDMRLIDVSGETAGSNGSGSIAVPPLGSPSCRLPTAASSPVTDEIAGRGADPAPGAGRLLTSSVEPPELASSLALRLPACWLQRR
jgi:hypothetical protein